MRFASLGSGSRGNATVIQHGQTTVLVDCGFGLRASATRLARLALEPTDISAILVTHEHNDHSAGVAMFARKHDVPVYTTRGTIRACENRWSGRKPFEIKRISPQESFSIDDLQIDAYPVPHDAFEPCQFVFTEGSRRLGVLSDCGWVTPYMIETLSGCDALLVEANHDPDMLEVGPYPDALKARVGGRLGHLSNAQTAYLLDEADCSRLQHVVLGHLSEQNNTAELARAAVATVLDCEAEWIGIADQDLGIQWRDVA